MRSPEQTKTIWITYFTGVTGHKAATFTKKIRHKIYPVADNFI
jgi:hypothetical protein